MKNWTRLDLKNHTTIKDVKREITSHYTKKKHFTNTKLVLFVEGGNLRENCKIIGIREVYKFKELRNDRGGKVERPKYEFKLQQNVIR
jgi:hypothetical protein